MYQRLSFLRNPRYAGQQHAAPAGATGLPGLRGSSTAHRHPAKATAASSSGVPARLTQGKTVTAAAAGFLVMPAQGALFHAYEAGGVYLQTLQLQNTGTVMQQVRLLPPTSRYFQASFPR